MTGEHDDEGIYEIDPKMVEIVISGFGTFKSLAERQLKKAKIDRGDWFSIEKWFNLLNKINIEVGSTVIKRIGENLAEKTPIPLFKDDDNDIIDILKSLNMGYYSPFRDETGKPMIHPNEDGKMVGGTELGVYELIDDKDGAGIIRVSGRYPCDLDLVFIRSIVDRYTESEIEIEHTGEDDETCRKDGASHCEYIVKSTD